MKRLLVLLAAVPMIAAAQGAPPPAAEPGPGPGMMGGKPTPEMMEHRMRLAVTLGLTEALQLSDKEALEVRDVLGAAGPRRDALRKQAVAAFEQLRRAAQGDKTAEAGVEQAVTRLFDARAQMQALDRETYQQITTRLKLAPDRRARALLVLARFHHHMGRMMGGGCGPGGCGRHGMGPGRGMGAGPGCGMMGPGGGMGMGPGAGMMEPGAGGPPEPQDAGGGGDDDL